ncbi:MAG: hypothetical protein HY873_14670 [Chloroflexi bacterium]|nr:hypothetical protein [Chloroflexota bacterium]
MSETLRWWFLLSIVGAVMLPLCLAVFRRLPDRGYALSKTFGLLVLGYVFWLLNSIHLVPNTPLGIILALVPLVALSGWFASREVDDLLSWVREHWRYIAGVEALFFFVFIAADWLRATVGEIGGTEQPMDLMFVTAATRADNFPPKDPWLSGHTVAYYYFGYLLVAMMGQLASVPTDVAYNIGIGMVAALALMGGAGVVYNLVHMRESVMAPEAASAAADSVSKKENKSRRRRQAEGVAETSDGSGASLSFRGLSWKPPLFGLFGGLMLTVMGNLVYALVFASSYGIGGKGLYNWIDVDGLAADEGRHGRWYPAEFFQFFGSTRIYPLDDADFRVITEFPMFSYVLGDLHPHVMALPFVLMVVGLALTLFRSPEPLDVTFWLQRPLLLVASALLLGGLTFINTWDVATLAFVVTAAAFVSNFTRVRRVTADLFVQVVSFAAPLVLLAFIFYVPFIISISGNSQADSFNAVVTNDRITVAGSRPVHAFLFWGPLFAVVVPFVLSRLWVARKRITLQHAGMAFLPSLVVLLGWLMVFLFMLATDAPNLGANYGNLFDQVADRGSAWLTAIFVAACLAASLLAIWAELTSNEGREEREAPLFALTLAAIAFLLILGCEFFYVGDVFRSRMNTVFKLYYQAWALLAVSGGFGLYYLASRWRFSFPEERPFRVAWAALAAIMLLGAAAYPIGGTLNRARPYNDGGIITVGGQLHGLASKNPDELKAIDWLNDRSKGQDFVIAEAVGGDYTEAGRISMATGLPAILGWGGHEDQWRGGTAKARSGRFEDVNALYQNADANRVQQIVQKYGVTYVYVGPLESQTYQGVLTDFSRILGEPVFQSGLVSIYLAR